MAERTCETCGAKNDVAARFCATCDAYLGWDVGRSTLGGDTLTGTIPRVVGSVTTDAGEEPGDAGAGSSPAASDGTDPWTVSGSGDVTGPRTTTPYEPAPQPAATDAAPRPAPGGTLRRDPPAVTVANPDVTITAEAAAEVELAIENTSNIVDGYVIEAVDPPAWLELAHPDTHLMPGEARTVRMSLAMRAGTLVLAQRVTIVAVVRSMEDPARSAEVRVLATVPPHGPRLALEAQPTLIRLEDADSGSFALRLDNRAANYPQTVELSGRDPENVVRFAFTPQVVEVPAGSMVEAAVTFAAPQPALGEQLSRQLTITATNDEGPITALVTLVQHTAPAPIDAPIRVQLEPSTLRLVDAHEADFEVRIDNRGGHSGVTVALSGRDPERRLAFAFAPARFIAVPGHVTRAHARLRAVPPPRGTSATYPFTVVANHGTTDLEGSGVVEISTSAPAITTAALRVDPLNLNIGTRRRGVFGVTVDNRRGAEPLQVALSARSADGLGHATFTPPQLAVGAGAIAHARMVVSSPRPETRQGAVRRLEVTAADGLQSLTTTAELTQIAPDRRGPWSKVLTIIGALVVGFGALSPWFAGFTPLLPFIEWIRMLIGSSSFTAGPEVVEPLLRLGLLVLALAMLFGLAGKAGGLTRKSAILVVLLTVSLLVFLAAMAFLPDLDFGLPVIWFGAVVGYVGGILARRRE